MKKDIKKDNFVEVILKQGDNQVSFRLPKEIAKNTLTPELLFDCFQGMLRKLPK